MCLAMPARVLSIDEKNENAKVSLGNVKVDVSLALVDDVKKDDYLLIHVGYALNKISEEEAQRTLQLFAETGLKDIV